MARWASRGSVSPCSCVAIYTSQQGWGSRPLRREVQALGVQDVCCLERMQRGFTEPLHKQLPQSPKDRKATTRMDALATKYQLPTRWRSGAVEVCAQTCDLRLRPAEHFVQFCGVQANIIFAVRSTPSYDQDVRCLFGVNAALEQSGNGMLRWRPWCEEHSCGAVGAVSVCFGLCVEIPKCTSCRIRSFAAAQERGSQFPREQSTTE